MYFVSQTILRAIQIQRGIKTLDYYLNVSLYFVSQTFFSAEREDSEHKRRREGIATPVLGSDNLYWMKLDNRAEVLTFSV